VNRRSLRECMRLKEPTRAERKPSSGTPSAKASTRTTDLSGTRMLAGGDDVV
jgi:hypothetical protein